MTGEGGSVDRKAVETWFVSRGLPHFIDDYSASRDVFTRALPLLTLILLVELVGALNFEWDWWVNVVVAVLSFAALLSVWVITNRLRRRPLLARADRVGGVELAVFVLVPALLPLAAGGQWLTALNTFLGNCLLLGLIYLGTSYGVLPLTRWAAGRLVGQLGALLGLVVRALPLLLLFVVFLFLTPELWQVAASLNGPFLALAVGLFVGLGVAFVVSRIPHEVRALAEFSDAAELSGLVADTPAAGLGRMRPDLAQSPPLGRRQWGNVGLVLLFAQGLQVIFVSLMIAAFLVLFGLITVSPQTAAAWVGHDVNEIVGGELWGRNVALTSELLQVAAFLATVAGFSFTLSLLTDDAYRETFLRDIVHELRQAFAVRVVYLSALAKEKSSWQ
jgi:hypothetical protein